MIERNKRQPMRARRLRENKFDEELDKINNNFLRQVTDIIKDRKGDIYDSLMPGGNDEELSNLYFREGSSYGWKPSLDSSYTTLEMYANFNDLYYSSRKPKVLKDWLEKTRTREEKESFEDYCKKRKLKANSPRELSEDDYMDYEEELDRIFEDYSIEAFVSVGFYLNRDKDSYVCQIGSWYDFHAGNDYKSKIFEIPFASLETANGREAVLDKIEKCILSVCDL